MTPRHIEINIGGQVVAAAEVTMPVAGTARTSLRAAAGHVAPGWRTSTGTYSVEADCTGAFTVSNGDQQPVHAQMIIARSGDTIHAVVIDPGIATTSDAERVGNSKK